MVTLATLESATAQEVFDQVAAHLLNQNKKCLDGDLISPICVYKNDEGLKCAAGCLIADEEYKPEFERKGWPEMITGHRISRAHRSLIISLQEIHDCKEVGNWKLLLHELAETLELEFKF